CIILAILVTVICLTEASMQRVTVKGVAVCHKHRVANVLVELWERDPVSNDLLASIHTNKDGEFSLTGENDEITAISPFVRIHHDCQVAAKKHWRCTRQTEYDVPSEFVMTEETNEKMQYDMTYVSLDIFDTDEKEHCERKN
ncbi:hypothetical protein PMAYCL1PPCAC_20671, partial [Pristionchus mayeri]